MPSLDNGYKREFIDHQGNWQKEENNNITDKDDAISTLINELESLSLGVETDSIPASEAINKLQQVLSSLSWYREQAASQQKLQQSKNEKAVNSKSASQHQPEQEIDYDDLFSEIAHEMESYSFEQVYM